MFRLSFIISSHDLLSNLFIRIGVNSFEVTHNLRIVLMGNTPPKKFSVHFSHFKFCF